MCLKRGIQSICIYHFPYLISPEKTVFDSYINTEKNKRDKMNKIDLLKTKAFFCYGENVKKEDWDIEINKRESGINQMRGMGQNYFIQLSEMKENSIHLCKSDADQHAGQNDITQPFSSFLRDQIEC